MSRTSILGVTLILWCTAAAACESDRAIYTQVDAPEFSFSFAKMKNPKAWSDLQATLKTPNRSLDFEFTASNGYEILNLVPQDEKLPQPESLPIVFFNTELKLLALPQSKTAAPTYLMVQGLGPWLWYAGLEPRDFIPTGMWKLTNCQ